MAKLKVGRGIYTDITGQIYNELTVLERVENTVHGGTQWLVQCSCGNQKKIAGNTLRMNRVDSCGCKRGHQLSGKLLGRLTVLREVSSNQHHTLWECQCNGCGSVTLQKGHLIATRGIDTCGCLGPSPASYSSLRHKFGLTPAQHRNMYEAQDRNCAFCLEPMIYKGAYVDHCHITDSIRGMVHPACNTTIGYIENNDWVLEPFLTAGQGPQHAYISKSENKRLHYRSVNAA